MTLTSPGVEVNILDETYTQSADAGTVPLIVIATASNKLTPSGSAIAPYTTTAKAGALFDATSQRDLLANFGNPLFWSSQGTPLHGYELNEFGLHAAWQTVGTQSRAYVLRAGIDLNALAPTRSAPRSNPANGTFWFDYGASKMGLFVSNGNTALGAAWTKITPLFTSASDIDSSFVPKASFGVDGQYAVVVQTTDNLVFEKKAGVWSRVGSSAWKAAHPTVLRGAANPAPVTGTISINGVTINGFTSLTLSAVVAAINSAAVPNVTASTSGNALVLTNANGGNITVANVSGTPLATLGLVAGTSKGVTLTFTNDASFPANSTAGDVWVKMTAPAEGTLLSLKRYNAATASWLAVSCVALPYDSTLLDGNTSKDTAAILGFGTAAPVNSLYLAYDAATGSRQFRILTANGWVALSYEANVVAPSAPAAAGTLWYSPDFKADIMVNNGTNWVGYTNAYPNSDPKGVIISASMPSVQSDGTPLVSNDLWLNTADLENYPALRRYDATTGIWGSVDTTDQSTPYGVVFADARADSGTSFAGQITTGYAYGSVNAIDLAKSDFVDPDAPDARRYPAGMLLFNSRVSTYNVKEWRPNHFQAGGFDAATNYTVSSYTVGDTRYTFPAVTAAGRWVTVSGNKLDGSPYMGRKAQRAMVVRSMQQAIADNEEIRSEIRNFTLIVAPGYPELLDEMANLNRDQAEVASIISGVPSRLAPRDIEAWAKNRNGAGENGEDGLVTAYEYAAMYYGWGLSTNVDGSNVVIPPCSVALATYLYNDRVGQVWFAPAGDERGIVTNATSVGYISSEGEFVPVKLNSAQRGVLAANKINPVVEIPGMGLRVMGQKTLAAKEGALDRVQGARLANYLRTNLARLTRPFLFQQNDAQTRGTAQITVERFFNSLVTLRAISDYAVLADETNNTKERQARRELWIDCAIRPLFAIEFILIPCRFRNDDLSF